LESPKYPRQTVDFSRSSGRIANEGPTKNEKGRTSYLKKRKKKTFNKTGVFGGGREVY